MNSPRDEFNVSSNKQELVKKRDVLYFDLAAKLN